MTTGVFEAVAFVKRRQDEMGIRATWRVERDGDRWVAAGLAPGGRNAYRWHWRSRSEAAAMVAVLNRQP